MRCEVLAGGPAIGRRTVIAGIFGALAVTPVAAEVSPFDQVKHDAEALAASMKALHGGNYWIHIDHDSGIVSVSLL